MLIQSEKMASIGTLTSSVAHKINNPIDYIYGNLKTLESYAKKFKNFCSFVQKIIDDYSKAKDDKTRELSEKLIKFKKENNVEFCNERTW